MAKRKLNLTPFKDYLIGKSKSKETIKSYTRTLNQFLKLINKKVNEDITKEDLQKYQVWANKTKSYKNNTLIPKYSAINVYLDYLDKPEIWIKKHRLHPPKQIVPNKTPFTRDEIKLLFKVSNTHPRDNALFKTFYYGMLRRSEIVNLNIDDIDFQRQKIRVGNSGFNPKRNKHAEINIHPDCLEAIKNYLEVREPKRISEKALFLNRYGNRIGKTDIHWTIKRYACLMGLKKKVYPHLFRISAITHMAQKGLNIEEIKRQSRHTDIETLMGYIQLSDEEVKEAYMRGISFEDKDIPKPKQEKQEPTDFYKDLELKLIERLATGQITSEAYSHAILKLKEKSNSEVSGYQ